MSQVSPISSGSPVGPTRVETQSTAVSVLMMAQVVYLILQVPKMTLATPEGIVFTSLWLFQALMAGHWWWGGQYYLAHLGPARSLWDIYFFFALLGASWVPALFIHDLQLYMATFVVAFLLAFARYRSILPSLPQGSGIREYVRKKSHVEIVGAALLGWGVMSATVLTDARLHAVMAASSVVIQLVMILYCTRRLYPLGEQAHAVAPASTGAVVTLPKASGGR